MSLPTKVLLIGGTSHTGKSTAAQRLAQQLGWDLLSTDQLARHPGRPWRADGSDLPPDVISHYSEHTPEQLFDAVLDHYQRNVWPIVVALITCRVRNRYDRPLVLEGSAHSLIPKADFVKEIQSLNWNRSGTTRPAPSYVQVGESKSVLNPRGPRNLFFFFFFFFP